MHRRTLMWSLVGLLLYGLCTRAADDSTVKEIDLKDVKSYKLTTKKGEPMVITSAEELAAAIPDQKFLDKHKATFDFTKQQLLIFFWSGSGQDKLTHKVLKENEKITVDFTRMRGRTKDLKLHYHLLVIPKDATFKFNQGA